MSDMEPPASRPMRLSARLARTLFLLVYSPLAVGPLFLAVVLMFSVVTFQGFVFALTALGLLAIPLVGAIFIPSKKFGRRRYIIPGSVAGFVLLLVLLLILLAPSGPPTKAEFEDGRTHSVFLPPAGYARFSPWNLLPEVDQTQLALTLLAWTDPHINGAKKKRIRDLILPKYTAQRSDPDLREMGSVMNMCVDDMVFGDVVPGHMYVALPDRKEGSSPPVIIFLHGLLGNFRCYQTVWQEYALANDVIVVTPTCGAGLWKGEAATEIIERARTFSIEQLGGDPRRVFLFGVSNGGLGALPALAANPNAFAGVALITPVFQPEHLDGYLEEKALAHKPVLILLAGQDLRVPAEIVRANLGKLEKYGMDIRLHEVEGEDHFLLMSAWDATSTVLADWMSTSLPSPR